MQTEPSSLHSNVWKPMHCNSITSEDALVLQCVFGYATTSAVQPSAQTFIHNSILFIDTYNNSWHNQTHWLIRSPYFATIASNDLIINRFDHQQSLNMGSKHGQTTPNALEAKFWDTVEYDKEHFINNAAF